MELQLLAVSFIAGTLTILAPCVFPLLPILLGSSADRSSSRNRAFTIVISLLVSIMVLTLAVHGFASSAGFSEGVLRAFSGTILAIIGLFMLFPRFWETISAKSGIQNSSNKYLARAMKKEGKAKDITIGVALGPVFSSCSPTYGLIIATILPQSFVQGFLYLLVYIFGLGLMFALLVIFGQRFTQKMKWATDPNGWFKRSLAILFIVIGLAVIFNYDKQFEAWLLNWEAYDALINFELNLR